MRPHPLVLVLAAVIAACRSTETLRPPEPKQIIDLSPSLTEDSACRQLGRRACEFLGVPQRGPFTAVVPAKPHHSYGMMTFTLLSHGGAHLDAPGRLLREGLRADQVPLNRLYGPARVWDLRWHDRHTPLQINDLSQQSEVQPGEVLLLLTGYSPPAAGEWPVHTWLSAQAASWLAARPLRALATDMPSIGNFEQLAHALELDRQPAEVWAERLAFFQAGIPVIEGLINLEQLVGEPMVVFAGLPLALADRSGAPMRAIALVY
ncbi:MAG: cyclase family protein [Deltaproteobacteria bacterium]|nr:cyclase family protein [Deltaproteobacteria bacterium]